MMTYIKSFYFGNLHNYNSSKFCMLSFLYVHTYIAYNYMVYKNTFMSWNDNITRFCTTPMHFSIQTQLYTHARTQTYPQACTHAHTHAHTHMYYRELRVHVRLHMNHWICE